MIANKRKAGRKREDSKCGPFFKLKTGWMPVCITNRAFIGNIVYDTEEEAKTKWDGWGFMVALSRVELGVRSIDLPEDYKGEFIPALPTKRRRKR